MQKLRKCLNLLSRKYSLLCSLLFSYLNNSNEECNEMDHGREQNNHERAEKLRREERGSVTIVKTREHNNAGLFIDNCFRDSCN